MNRPSLSVRLAGSPRGALLLFICYGVIWYGWYEGHTVWWVALGTVGAALRTLRARRDLQRYKAWLADWQAMGAQVVEAPQQQPLPKKKRRRARAFVTASALLVLAIPLLLPSTDKTGTLGPMLAVLWCVACLYLVFALVRGLLRRRAGGHRAETQITTATDEAAPVAWLVDRPSSSPSRAEAERDLPEYCARLISRNR
jgi:hypothetical protein